MGHRLLQSFLETKCPEANSPVDFGKMLVPADAATVEGAAGGDAPAVPEAAAAASPGFKLLVDAESCLDRLYGGKHADWLAGGDWNRMIEFLTSLRDACRANGISLVVILNGALEVSHMPEWAKGQAVARAHVKTALKEIYRPRRMPGRLWVAPAGLRTALRLALRQLGIETSCSTEEHRLEVMALARDRRVDGVMARHGSYVVFNPPRYFSASLFKLTFKKEVLTTEHVVDNLAKALDLHQDRFCVFGTLLGNHILTADELKPFHDRLTKEEGAVEAAVEAPAEGENAAASTATPAKSVVAAVADFVRRQPSVDDLDAIAVQVFDAGDAELFKHMTDKLKASVVYYFKGTEKGHGRRPIDRKKENSALKNVTPPPTAAEESTPPLPYTPFGSDSEEEKRQLLTETLSPSTSVSQLTLLRHQRGLLSPLILQVLTHRHVKLESIIEDASDEETPSAVDLYQDLRRRVYGILLDAKSKKPEELVVNEWFASEENPEAERPRPVTVAPLDPALDIPSLESLWFSAEPEDGQRRLRAFLACMKANDDAGILDKDKIPRQYLVPCVVLRYILEYGKETGKPLLTKAELEAFLATAVCPMMRNVRVTKELQLRKINKRGLALGALFMQGVEFACLANDACGAPIPWQVTCPWEFFDGKIFHLKLIKAVGGSPLLEVCDNKVQHLVEVERMRDAILGNRDFAYAEPKTDGAVAAAADADAASAAAPAVTPKASSKKAKGKKATPLLPLPVNRVGTTPPFPKSGKMGGEKEAEIYAAAYAHAYVAYCTSGGGTAPQPKAAATAAPSRQQLEAEAYAKGYATAMAGSGGSPFQQMAAGGYKRPNLSQGQSQRPPARPFHRPRGGSAQARVIRQAAAYANYHTAGIASPNPVGGRGGGRGGRKGAKSQTAGFPAVDARTPAGPNWNTIVGF